MINITSSHHSNRGFTMAEALVGLVILALGLLSLAKFQTSLIESSGLTKARTAAINIGQDKVEELRSLINKGEFITVDTSTDPYTYSSGSLIATGSDTQTGVNAIYTREWNISNTPATSNDPDRVNIDVTVTWTDATNTTQSIKLSSIITWLDPAAGSVSTTSTNNTIATLQFPAAGARTGDGSSKLDTDDALDISEEAPDTTRIAITRGGIIYLIDRYDVILLTATTPLTTISGIIGLGDDTETTEAELALIDVVTSDAGYCSYPLDPSTGIPDSITLSQTKAYICYVAGGWYGGVGIFGFNPDDDACAGKAREYRGELLSTDGTIIGTLGVTENQSGDDFILAKLKRHETCDDVTIPEGFTDTDSDSLPGPIEDEIVIVSTTIGAIPISGMIIIDATSTPAASSQYTSLTVATTSTTTDPVIEKACDPVVYNSGDAFATYSCEVENGWSGIITLSGADDSDKTCVNVTSTPVESNIIDLSGVTIIGNQTGNNFVIVEDRVDCSYRPIPHI